MLLILFCSRRTAYIVRDNAKQFTSVRFSYKSVILFFLNILKLNVAHNLLLYSYTGCKGNECHPFNSRRGWLKGLKNLYTMSGLNLIVSSEKCFLFFGHVVLLISLEIMRKHLYHWFSNKDVTLFSKIFYMFDVVYVKSNSFSC